MPTSSNRDHARLAMDYASDVVAGRIVAGLYTRLACDRFQKDLERSAKDPLYPYRFDPAKVSHVCRWVELMPHVKGQWAARRESIVLAPFQCFIVANVFGWVNISTGLRRFRQAFILIARKNAKSALTAAVSTYMTFCDQESGAEVYTGANSERQAMEIYRPAAQMIDSRPELRDRLGITIGKKGMYRASDNSRFEVVVRKPGDGASPHMACVDEWHEAKDDALFSTFVSGMGARQQPLMWIISTAGVNLGSPCYAEMKNCQKILEGSVTAEDVFAVIYSADDGDEWDSDAALEKANPALDIAISRDYLIKQRDAARRDPAQRPIYQTKHCNLFVAGATGWLDIAKWNRLGDKHLRIEDFQGCPAVMGIDLASKLDIAGRVIAFRKDIEGKPHFYVFPFAYLPEAAPVASLPHVRGWSVTGEVVLTDGNILDFDRFTREAITDIQRFQVTEVAIDPWGDTAFVQRVDAETKTTVVEVKQNVQNLSPAMREVEALIADGRLHHPASGPLSWNVSNIEVKEDHGGNIFPRKSRPDNKIDLAVAMVLAIGRIVGRSGLQGTSIYETRGLRFL